MSFTQALLEEEHLNKLKEWLPRRSFSHEYNPGKYILTKFYGDILPDILDLKIRKDDVFVISYPRTGSTWCQEIVWLLVNKLDYKKANEVQQYARAPIIEGYAFFDHENETWNGHPLKNTLNITSSRCIRTHSPYGLLPKEIKTVKPKIIYTMRNPKDEYCSLYYLFDTVFGITASFEEAAELYLQNKLPFGGFFDHCLEYWDRRHESNILVLKYEDMLADTKKTIKDIANFLEISITDAEVEELFNFVSFENMKKNAAINLETMMKALNKDDTTKEGFIRQGKVGTWRNKISPELSKKFDKWIEENTKGTDLSFNFG